MKKGRALTQHFSSALCILRVLFMNVFIEGCPDFCHSCFRVAVFREYKPVGTN
jgi:hypothetical protein